MFIFYRGSMVGAEMFACELLLTGLPEIKI